MARLFSDDMVCPMDVCTERDLKVSLRYEFPDMDCTILNNFEVVRFECFSKNWTCTAGLECTDGLMFSGPNSYTCSRGRWDVSGTMLPRCIGKDHLVIVQYCD